ncbi:MAG: hypothetical protein C0418_04765 [Coriobacteriaceae bacterium]|nr:hypothetical protein [Coriobacteriaceae bacterium]
MAEGTGSHVFCPHCGAPHTRRLGRCDVCRHPVCERCGNIQHRQGERAAVHNECLKEAGGGFSMIRIVR